MDENLTMSDNECFTFSQTKLLRLLYNFFLSTKNEWI